MHFDFWAARWNQQQLGFHLKEVNSSLLSHGPQWLGFDSWSDHQPLRGRRILVPLCGKTLDLRWLARHGAEVTGVEFVEQAAVAFFAEQQLDHTQQHTDQGKVFVCSNPGMDLRIAVGDFFEVPSIKLGAFDAVYDRAALVALEPTSRARYADRLADLSKVGARLLLVTFEHDTGGGPPFSVPSSDVRALFGKTFAPEVVRDSNLIDDEPKYRERGATQLRELVWIGERQPAGALLADAERGS